VSHSRAELWRLDATGIGVCAALAVAWYFLGLAPLTDAKHDRVHLEDDLARAQERLDALDAAAVQKRSRLAELRTEYKSKDIKLETVAQLNERLARLSELAVRYKLKVDELKPGPSFAAPHYTAVPIRLAGHGTYPQCAQFFHALQEDQRDMGVAAFELRGEPEAPDKPPSFGVQLLWYAAAEPPKPTEKKSP
jgi:Tfp pilus assembly protein PilO